MQTDQEQHETNEGANDDLSEIAETIRTLDGNEDGDVSVGEIAAEGGAEGILPVMFLVALIASTPLSGIPGVSVVCGLLIALLSLELIFQFSEMYLPRKLKKLSIDAGRLQRAMEKARPVLAWIDKHTGDRLTFLFHRPMIWVPQGLCLISGLAMPFLEMIPFTSSIAAVGVCLLSIAMLTRDGLFFILALVPYGAGVYLLTQVLA